jgi:hypothetical protein
MRILRGLSSKFLPCGCLAGVYETYDGDVVAIVDAKGSSCPQAMHENGNMIPVESSGDTQLQANVSSPRPPVD